MEVFFIYCFIAVMYRSMISVSSSRCRGDNLLHFSVRREISFSGSAPKRISSLDMPRETQRRLRVGREMPTTPLSRSDIYCGDTSIRSARASCVSLLRSRAIRTCSPISILIYFFSRISTPPLLLV